jgi:hypothetical protein
MWLVASPLAQIFGEVNGFLDASLYLQQIINLLNLAFHPSPLLHELE